MNICIHVTWINWSVASWMAVKIHIYCYRTTFLIAIFILFVNSQNGHPSIIAITSFLCTIFEVRWNAADPQLGDMIYEATSNVPTLWNYYTTIVSFTEENIVIRTHIPYVSIWRWNLSIVSFWPYYRCHMTSMESTIRSKLSLRLLRLMSSLQSHLGSLLTIGICVRITIFSSVKDTMVV